MFTFSSFIWSLNHQLNYAFGLIIIEFVCTCGVNKKARLTTLTERVHWPLAIGRLVDVVIDSHTCPKISSFCFNSSRGKYAVDAKEMRKHQKAGVVNMGPWHDSTVTV